MSAEIEPLAAARSAAGGRRVIHGDLSQIAGRPWTYRLSWIVLLAAAAVDIVTFNQVLELAINETPTMLWILVVGFTLVAIALAHHAGLQARQSTNPRNPSGARTTAWLAFSVWLLLGIIAFVFRWVSADPAGGADSTFVVDGPVNNVPTNTGASSQHLSALFFLALYLGTGLVSALAGFLRHDPAAKQYARTVNRRSKIARRHADSRSLLAAANQIKAVIASERQRQQDGWEAVRRQAADTAAQLKEESRVLVYAVRNPPRPY